MRGLAAASVLLLGGCAADMTADRAASGQRLKAELAGFDQGETQDCLPIVLDNVTPRIVDQRTIVYQQTRTVKWVSSLPAACPGLRPTSTLVIRRFGARTCRADSFQAFDSGPTAIAGGLCRFGAFVRYQRAQDL